MPPGRIVFPDCWSHSADDSRSQIKIISSTQYILMRIGTHTNTADGSSHLQTIQSCREIVISAENVNDKATVWLPPRIFEEIRDI